jgi:predicted molibdopterin-dependent oxidoreductase YjgC
MNGDDGRIDGLGDRPSITFTFDGAAVDAKQGDSVAMALWAAGVAGLRKSSREGAARGVLCNMGICYECLVTIDGATARACMTVVREGMAVRTGGKP